MTNRSRQIGTRAETAVVGYLRANGFPHAERRALSGALDRGDIAGVIGCAIEVKACARQELAAWLDEAAREAANDRALVGAVWHKRRGRSSPAEWFVTMDGETFTFLLREALGIVSETPDGPQ